MYCSIALLIVHSLPRAVPCVLFWQKLEEIRKALEKVDVSQDLQVWQLLH